jgi:hypothetical protein
LNGIKNEYENFKNQKKGTWLQVPEQPEALISWTQA